MNSTTYARYFFVITFIALTAISAFNVLVDPFKIFHEKKFKGFNDVKSGLFNSIRIVPAISAYRKKPDLIILGTSRAINGLRCEHAELSKFNCENLAIAGSTIYESFRYFQHANAISPLKTAIIGIDFFSFNQSQGLSHQLNEDILAASEDGTYQYKNYRLELLKLSVSNDTLSHSRKTIRNSRYAARKDKTRLDKTLDSNTTVSTYHKWKQQCEGYLKLIWFPEQDPRFQLLDEFNKQSLLSKFRLLVREAHKNNVQTYFVISPSHAWLWESLDAGGLWHTFEDWKAALVKITESEALSAGKTPFPVWDFSGYNHITTSKAPRLHGKDVTPAWYTDPSHYNPAIGNMVINKILGIKSAIRDVPNDFGIIITSKNIKEHLAHIRQTQAKYRRTHTTEVTMIKKLARDAETYREKAWQKRSLKQPAVNRSP